MALSRNIPGSSDKAAQLPGWHSIAHSLLWCSRVRAAALLVNTNSNTANTGTGTAEISASWGGPGDLLAGIYSAEQPVPPHWLRMQQDKQAVSAPSTAPGKNRLSCLEGLLRQTWLSWIQASGTSGQTAEEGMAACKMERGKSVFYHKESYGLSLTPGNDVCKTPPAASLAKKRKKILF